MTPVLRFSRDSRENLKEISDFISDQSGSEDIAEAFVATLVERCRKLAGLPGQLGTPRPELLVGLRSTPHRSYVIFFRYLGDTFEVVNVLHGSRDVYAQFDTVEER